MSPQFTIQVSFTKKRHPNRCIDGKISFLLGLRSTDTTVSTVGVRFRGRRRLLVGVRDRRGGGRGGRQGGQRGWGRGGARGHWPPGPVQRGAVPDCQNRSKKTSGEREREREEFSFSWECRGAEGTAVCVGGGGGGNRQKRDGAGDPLWRRADRSFFSSQLFISDVPSAACACQLRTDVCFSDSVHDRAKVIYSWNFDLSAFFSEMSVFC